MRLLWKFKYVFLPPKLWEVVRDKLGREMRAGTLPDGSKFLQEVHVRYVKTRNMPEAR